MNSRIAIIPARGGSKRIPQKNIRNFCGKPMINYVLQVAKESQLFDKIHVSTDSEEIAGIVEELGFKVDFMRPSELADDYTPLMPVLKYVVEQYEGFGDRFEEVWLLMPCSPLLEIKDLIDASTLFGLSGENATVNAVSEYPVPIEWAFSKTSTGVMIPVSPGQFAVRSQDLEKKYYDTGIFSIFPVEKIRNSQGAGSDTDTVGYVYPKYKAVDTDDEEDWLFAELLFKVQRSKSLL